MESANLFLGDILVISSMKPKSKTETTMQSAIRVDLGCYADAVYARKMWI